MILCIFIADILINRMQKLDKTAFEQLFREHFTPLVAFANKFLHDIDSSKEIVHDAYIKLWEKRDTIDLSKSVKSYLFTSVYNRSLNYIRDHKKFMKEEMDYERFDTGDYQDSSRKMIGKEIEQEINQSIESLPEACKNVFLLSRFEGLKYAEIAEKLGISVKTVEAQMSKALKILREKLKEYIPLLLLVMWQNMN